MNTPRTPVYWPLISAAETSGRSCAACAATPSRRRTTSTCTCACTAARDPSSVTCVARPSERKVTTDSSAFTPPRGSPHTSLTEPSLVNTSESGQTQQDAHGRASLRLRRVRAALHREGRARPPQSQQARGGPAALLPDLRENLQRLEEISAQHEVPFSVPCLVVIPVMLLVFLLPPAKEQLRVHVRRHQGARKFECVDCGYKFTRLVGAPAGNARG